MDEDIRVYLDYYHSHPEEFKDEPPLGACGTVSIIHIESDESTDGEIDRSSVYRRERWEKYHLSKSKSIGFEIDIDLLAKRLPLKGSNFDIFE